MAALTVRELPEKTLITLKNRAVRNHRSLNGEILHLFDYIASFGPQFEFSVTKPESPDVTRQRESVLALAGQWEDDRSDAEIIADIEGSRTLGREVEL